MVGAPVQAHHSTAGVYDFDWQMIRGGATCTESDPHCVICPLLPDCSAGKMRVARRMADG